MNKTTLLTTAVIALCILNLVVLFSFFVLSPSKKSLRKLPKDTIIKRLHFDEQQIQAYEKSIEFHKVKTIEVGDSIKMLKKALYSLLNQQDDSEKDAIIQKINNLQKEIEYVHYYHFQDIKKLCTDKQLDDFKLLAEDLVKIFRPPGPPPPSSKK